MAIAIVSPRICDECRAALAAEGFSVRLCPESDALPAPICHHPDSLMAHFSGRLFCPTDYYNKNTAFFSSLGYPVHTVEERHGGAYPEDCAFNLLTLGKNAFFHPRALPTAIKDALHGLGYRALPTRQGYAACSVCRVDGTHAITADMGMARVLKKAGVTVLSIEEGGILLPPYAHGFIGGASGVYGNRVYFFGDIKKHPSYAAIEDFLGRAGFTPVSLSGGPLRDLGGILFLQEGTDEYPEAGHEDQPHEAKERIPRI